MIINIPIDPKNTGHSYRLLQLQYLKRRSSWHSPVYFCIIARQAQTANSNNKVLHHCKVCFVVAHTLRVQVDSPSGYPFQITLIKPTIMIFLTVPFAEKDQAKALGARWNAAQKKWYVPDGTNSTLFEKWHPQAVAGSGDTGKSVAKGASMMEVGLTITGEKYLARDHDCIPWDPCTQCDEAIAKPKVNFAIK
ncbi:MAG: hypothetical protein ACI9ZF_002410 [Bradyrhizobium sp.]